MYYTSINQYDYFSIIQVFQVKFKITYGLEGQIELINDIWLCGYRANPLGLSGVT